MKTNFNWRGRTLAVVCGLVLTPAALRAATSGKTTTEHGILKSLDTLTHSIVVTDKKTKGDRTFQWNEHTKFTERGKAVPASDLKTGEHLIITYSPNKAHTTDTMLTVSVKAAKLDRKSHPTLGTTSTK